MTPAITKNVENILEVLSLWGFIGQENLVTLHSKQYLICKSKEFFGDSYYSWNLISSIKHLCKHLDIKLSVVLSNFQLYVNTKLHFWHLIPGCILIRLKRRLIQILPWCDMMWYYQRGKVKLLGLPHRIGWACHQVRVHWLHQEENPAL